MTMHLIKGVHSLNTRKPKQKITKAKQVQLEQDFKEYNKFLKSKHMAKITFEEYVDQVFGRVKKEKKKPESFTDTMPVSYRANTYASVTSTKSTDSCAKKESMVYSGEQKLLGIATLHKSCLQPVFDADYAKDVARMRRN
jgi:hypothetical protein